MINRAALGFCIVVLGLSHTQSAAAQNDDVAEDDAIDREPVKCVPMGQIQSTTAANDDSILFYRSGGRIYVNILERQCQGLRRSGLFTYKVRSGIRVARLCDTDSITVIDKTTNSAGLTCRLGVFHPITDVQAEEILYSGRVSRTIVAEPVEPPDDAGSDEVE